ncbi:hypothetical protein IIA79_04230 [bacterium]|nr:hypothetical protein [bacterium]
MLVKVMKAIRNDVAHELQYNIDDELGGVLCDYLRDSVARILNECLRLNADLRYYQTESDAEVMRAISSA